MSYEERLVQLGEAPSEQLPEWWNKAYARHTLYKEHAWRALSELVLGLVLVSLSITLALDHWGLVDIG